MSIEIMTEVWKFAPVDQGSLLVLLTLADSAQEDTRSCYPGIETIALRSRLSERQVKRCIQELIEAGVLLVKRNASHVKTNLYQITPHNAWRSDILSPPRCDAHVTSDVTSVTGRCDAHVTSDVTPMSPKPLVTEEEPKVTVSVRDELTLLSEEDAPKIDKVENAFHRFWSVYPKKSGKPAAHRNFLRAVKAGADPEKIISAATIYAASKSVADGFVKHPQGWLTDERFNDEDLRPQQSRPRAQPWGEVVR